MLVKLNETMHWFHLQCPHSSQSTLEIFAHNQPNIFSVLQVTVNNEESDESFESSWSYMQHIQSNALWGHDRRKFHKDVTESKVMARIHSLVLFLPLKLHHLHLLKCLIQAYRLIMLKNKVELAQFQNSAPEYLILAEGFWRALSSLPNTYDYSAYRKLFQTYGTHYFSEGSLGGQYQALLELTQKALSSSSNYFV